MTKEVLSYAYSMSPEVKEELRPHLESIIKLLQREDSKIQENQDGLIKNYGSYFGLPFSTGYDAMSVNTINNNTSEDFKLIIKALKKIQNNFFGE